MGRIEDLERHLEKRCGLSCLRSWEQENSRVFSVHLLLFLVLFPVAWSHREKYSGYVKRAELFTKTVYGKRDLGFLTFSLYIY